MHVFEISFSEKDSFRSVFDKYIVTAPDAEEAIKKARELLDVAIVEASVFVPDADVGVVQALYVVREVEYIATLDT